MEKTIIAKLTAATKNAGLEDESICIHFYALEKWFWINALDLAECGGSITEFLIDNCELTETECAFIMDRDYDICDDNGGLIGAFCDYAYGHGFCNFKKYCEALETGVDHAVLIAGLSIGIEIDSIEDAYCGEYDSDVDFAEQYLDDCEFFHNIPDEFRFYFAYKAFTRDLMMSHCEANGHYFRNC